MLADAIRMTSSTGGTGTLTCSAQTGYPAVSEAFTGTRYIQYSIAEYTSSAKTQLSKFETGIGSYNTSTDVLTRSVVQSTWDGTDYLPKFGTATAPSALSFGSTSANIDIFISLTTAGARLAYNVAMAASASVTDGYGLQPISTGSMSGAFTPTSGLVVYFPVEMPWKQYSQVAFRQTTATTGGSPTVDVAIYEMDETTGFAGRQLCAFTQKAVGAANTSYQTTALATPVPFGGWVWVAFLFLVGGGSGGAFRGMNTTTSGPIGSLFSTNPANAPLSVGSQTTLNDPATAATGMTAVSALPALVFS